MMFKFAPDFKSSKADLFGVKSEIIALINETSFDYLKGPAQRVTSVDTPMPYCQVL